MECRYVTSFARQLAILIQNNVRDLGAKLASRLKRTELGNNVYYLFSYAFSYRMKTNPVTKDVLIVYL